MRNYTDALFEGLELDERWYTGEGPFGERGKVWYSDSAIEFKNFMRNLPNTGMKGARLIVSPGHYLVANAEDINHDTMWYIMVNEYGMDIPNLLHSEYYTVGMPKCTDFALGNYEMEELKQYAKDTQDPEYAKYLNYDADSDFYGALIVDCGTFEVCCYRYDSTQYDFRTSESTKQIYIEDTELYKVLKPLLKRIYIYGKE